ALPAELLLDVDVRARAGFVAALEAFLVADAVELSAVDATALLAVDGPDAAGLLGVADLAPFAHVETSVSGVPGRAVRASEVRGDGVILSAPAGQAAALWDTLVAAGARPCGMEALGGRRVEGGGPRLGRGMGAETGGAR